MIYRREIEKIYRRIDNIAKRGEDSYMEFIDLVDDIISNNQYYIFEDVVLTKYNINVSRKYNSIEQMKKNLFKEIRFQTKSRFSTRFQNLLIDKNVTTKSLHYYNSSTNKYLGDIKEFDTQTYDPYNMIDTRLAARLNLSRVGLEITVGLSASILEAVPEFDQNYVDRDINYVTYSQVVYNGNLYECINSYTWIYGDIVTPTYSYYWTQSFVPTYSVISLSASSTDDLIEFYSRAIDIMKSYY